MAASASRLPFSPKPAASPPADRLFAEKAPADSPAPRRRQTGPFAGELATQTPHDLGYSLQQFVRLTGVQYRMSADEVAYHNRTQAPRKT